MIILIAEAKTMKRDESVISRERYEANIPAGENQASEIMESIQDIPVADLASTVKISLDMARNLKKMAYEFPNKSLGFPAIEAFTGIVFKSLDFTTIPLKDKEWTEKHLRIISSLYGWLKPSDIIKPYRLDYSAPLSPKHNALYAFWRPNVTDELIRFIKESGEDTVLNLLPGEAAKSIDWIEVRKFTNVYKVDFKELNGNSVSSPHAGRLKAMRGAFLRTIILNRITHIENLKTLTTELFCPIEGYDAKGAIGFYV